MLFDEKNFHIVRHFQFELVFNLVAVRGEPCHPFDPERLCTAQLIPVKVVVLGPDGIALFEHLFHHVLVGIR